MPLFADVPKFYAIEKLSVLVFDVLATTNSFQKV